MDTGCEDETAGWSVPWHAVCPTRQGSNAARGDCGAETLLHYGLAASWTREKVQGARLGRTLQGQRTSTGPIDCCIRNPCQFTKDQKITSQAEIHQIHINQALCKLLSLLRVSCPPGTQLLIGHHHAVEIRHLDEKRSAFGTPRYAREKKYDGRVASS